ncbi:MAG: transcription antitermination factor NusB [Clostridiales bacterium GWE2_32_10]|nr:MAG: transcription antitermination factor NusB [Clostridiales bacterium GWE2_32_10]HBY20043.1 transcription antitermination factor NusB [Clostridiales bacterium]
MKRREAREYILQILFQIDFHPREEFEEKINLYLQCNDNLDEEMKEFIISYAEGVASHVDEIDDILNKKAKGWKTTRMSNADLTILRIAVYEISFMKDVPVSISINEAVELAKKYSDDSSPSFINALLGDIVNTDN